MVRASGGTRGPPLLLFREEMGALERIVEGPRLVGDPLEVITHVGRDILANVSHFATVPKAVHEYVSNAIDATPPGRAATVQNGGRMPRSRTDLTRPGEPSQRTKTGIEIPIPQRGEFFGIVEKAATTPPVASRRGRGKRRTSRAR